MSEFGFQSLPPLETICTYADEADWNMTSYIMEHHQKNDSDNGLIIVQMTNTFPHAQGFSGPGLFKHGVPGRRVGVIFSDNYFDLPAGRTISVSCPLPPGWAVGRARAALIVRSLYDSFA